jgi:hypothetical protein
MAVVPVGGVTVRMAEADALARVLVIHCRMVRMHVLSVQISAQVSDIDSSPDFDRVQDTSPKW